MGGLPEGLDLAALDEYVRQREKERRRADYARHPERAIRQRVSSYTNFLRRNGRIVLECPPAPPWTAAQRAAILAAVAAEVQNNG